MKSLVVFAAAMLSAQALSAECWLASNFSGRSAQADRDYQFAPDSFGDGMLVCFTEDGGMVTGSDLQLFRIGPSTLLGYGSNGLGLETVNVYQIDRGRRKLLITQTRIGTATITNLLPDYAAVFVADVVRAD